MWGSVDRMDLGVWMRAGWLSPFLPPTTQIHIYIEPVLPALVRALVRAQEELRECGMPAGGDGQGGLAATVAWFR